MVNMADITTLRHRTGAVLLVCKKALEEAKGDIEVAIDAMRKLGQVQAARKSDRVTREGFIVILTALDNKSAVMLEVNSETDFVSRNEVFRQFSNQVAQLALDHRIQDCQYLPELPFDKTGQTVEQARQALVGKTGENIRIRRLQFMQTQYQLGFYTHMGRRGALVELQDASSEMVREIAIHIVASQPLVISCEDISEEMLTKLQVAKTEVSLLTQPFIKDPAMTVAQYLGETKVIRFTHFILGEEIEDKKKDIFASEIIG